MKTEDLYRIFIEESTGISIDTRSIKKGQLFFALCGHNYNGNRFADEAIAKGALYAVIDDPDFENSQTILVDNTRQELMSLATYHREMTNAKVLAITGSNGKTTTKELIAAILSKKFRVHYTQGNLNNELGLSLTVLSSNSEADMMILEMGANHIGEIRTLCKIAQPGYGIITNFGNAHIEGFGSFEGVIKAKTELYEYLAETGGIAIYNDNNNYLSEKIFGLKNKAVPYSCPLGFPLSVEVLPSGISLVVKFKYRDNAYEIKTNLFGSYNLENIIAAIATGLFFGVSAEDIADVLTSYQPHNNRSQIRVTNNNTIVCDAYNANPTSMANAIQSFSGIRADRKVVILGDMLELGDQTAKEHLKLIELIRQLDTEKVFLVGKYFEKASSGTRFLSFSDVDRLVAYLRNEPIRDCYVLVKGSRGMALEKTYDLL